MSKTILPTVMISSALVICSCGTYAPVDVARPSDITVPTAMQDVALGLVALRKELAVNNHQFGLLVDEVQVDFNVTANSKDQNTLSLDLARVTPAGFISSGAVGYDGQRIVTGDRGNKITIKLKNIYTANVNDLAHFIYGAPRLTPPREPAGTKGGTNTNNPTPKPGKE